MHATGTDVDGGGSVGDIETHQTARNTGQFENYDEEVKLGQSIVKLLSFEEWSRQRKADAAAAKSARSEIAPGWNGLSVLKMVTGRS